MKHQCPSYLTYLIIFFFLLLAMSSQAFSDSNSTDWTTLLTFKSMITDPSNTLASWQQQNNTNLHFCLWRGVTCGHRHPDRVTSLILDSLNLAGSLPPHIANLTLLRRLSLSSNSFTGSIPPELGRLSWLMYINLTNNHLNGWIPSSLTLCSNLQTIDLSNNELSGEIPRDIGSLSQLQLLILRNNSFTGSIPESLTNCSKLQALSLRTNELSGEIPTNIGSLLELKLLSLSWNNFAGTIPRSLGNISSLSQIYLQGNDLVGSIPESMGRLSSLQLLELNGNKLSGNIPFFIFNLSSITYLTLSNNSFTGTLPPNMFDTLPNLRTLLLYMNQLEGPIPLSLSNATHIAYLEISENNFTGTIPPNLGNLRNLTSIELSDNQLEANEPGDWDFLTSLANCSYLENIGIELNNLGSVLPLSVANLPSSLQYLSMDLNQIAGSIPDGIGNLSNLKSLSLYSNLLAGSIPHTIGNLEQLDLLGLSDNRLTGKIPYTIGNLAQLNSLHLDGNRLNGSIPASLGKCQNLQLLDLTQNMLTNVIPRELLMLPRLSIFLNLSHNFLTGLLPLEVGQLANLNTLDISDNRLSGEIPTTLADCQSLEIIYMQHNFFSGDIPQSLRGLKGLQVLDLSQNNLSGEVPQYMGSLGSLQYLNLSYNHLEGEVPDKGIFTNATKVSVLGNKNLCGDSPNLHLPSCQTKITEEHHRPTLVIKVVTPVLAASLCTLILFLVIFYTRPRHKDQQNKSPSTSFMEGQFKQVSYAELLKATDGFSQSYLIGVGGFGSVYRGTLNLGESTTVAVKVLNLQQRGASKSFLAECDVLKNIRHRNLVKILTSCSSVDFSGNEFKALVLEFMPNGSLEKWLHPATPEHFESMPLSLDERLNIAIDVASALEYIHHHGETPIIHCDLKPSNILLDANMCAHVGDFGLARLIWENFPYPNENQTTSSGIKGTIGYIAPEYGMGGQASTYGDVFSYGILLLEFFTGKRPTDIMFKDGLSLYSYAEMAFPKGVMDILDSRLHLIENDQETRDNNQNEEDRVENIQILVSLIGIGISCSKQEPRERMEVKEIKQKLHALKDALQMSHTHEERLMKTIF